MATKKPKSEPTPDMNDVAARALAEKIVRDIMTDGNGKSGIADRLVLENAGRLGGGWGFGPLCDRVHDLLTGRAGD